MILLDKIIWGFLAFFFLSGWLRGFSKSLIGPVAFIFCFISAVIFYDLNRNILMAAVITFAGTIALALCLSVILAVTMAAINKEYRGKVFLLSRILGAATNVAWQGNILFITIVMFSIVPFEQGLLATLQKQVGQSTMMTYYKVNVVNKDSRYQALVASFESISDPAEVERIVQTDKFKAFAADPKVQAFVNDPNVAAAIEEKDPIKILKTSSLRQLVTNDGSMATFTKLTEMVYMDQLDRFQGPADPQPGH